MTPRFYLDTNVLLDFFLARDPFARPSSILLDSGLKHRCKIYISTISFCNVAHTLQIIEKKRIIEKDLELLLNCVSIAPNHASLLSQALSIPCSDYEDAVQLVSALETQCTHLVTANTQNFRNARIKVIDPIEAVRILDLSLLKKNKKTISH